MKEKVPGLVLGAAGLRGHELTSDDVIPGRDVLGLDLGVAGLLVHVLGVGLEPHPASISNPVGGGGRPPGPLWFVEEMTEELATPKPLLGNHGLDTSYLCSECGLEGLQGVVMTISGGVIKEHGFLPAGWKCCRKLQMYMRIIKTQLCLLSELL